MIDKNFEDLAKLAKFIGYDNVLDNVTNDKNMDETDSFSLYSKIPIVIDDSYIIDGETYFLIHPEWMKMCKLDILTSASFSPNNNSNSLKLCSTKMLSFYNTKVVKRIEGLYYTTFSDVNTKYNGIEQEIVGKGEDEFESTYIAILNHIKTNM